LFFRPGPFRPDPGKSAAWNRGAYLAEGLGHCGACHTPRNELGAEERDRALSGGIAEGWNAYPIDAHSPAPIPWDASGLAFYLRNGWQAAHGVSRGPMAEVTGNLAGLGDSDIAAIAEYIADRMGAPDSTRQGQAKALAGLVVPPGSNPTAPEDDQVVPAAIGDAASADRGAAIYAATCSTCHDAKRALPYGALNLRLSTAVNAANPQNIVNVVMFGLPQAEGRASAVMPAFGSVLSDPDIVALLRFMRRSFGGNPVRRPSRHRGAGRRHRA
jgi:mono/diheme cytochrome c family protein